MQLLIWSNFITMLRISSWYALLTFILSFSYYIYTMILLLESNLIEIIFFDFSYNCLHSDPLQSVLLILIRYAYFAFFVISLLFSDLLYQLKSIYFLYDFSALCSLFFSAQNILDILFSFLHHF